MVVMPVPVKYARQRTQVDGKIGSFILLFAQRVRTLFMLTSFVLIVSLLAGPFSAAHAADDAGYRNFSYGSTCTATPTGEKPESKLWWNDGFWWGSLCDSGTNAYFIYRLDLARQTWVKTQTALDPRPGSRADVLWDAASQKLYVVSHVFTTNAASTTDREEWGRLYRYSYTSASDTYSLDTGFPVDVTRGTSETLVIDKDSTGQLWITYVESGKVMVNHSTTSDSTWRTPFVLPVNTGANNLATDDISSLIAFDGRIGILWSNQTDKTMYFASHTDTADDMVWSTPLSVYSSSDGAADDHINLKLQSDGKGIYVVVKTSYSAATSPLIVLLACRSSCTTLTNWRPYTVYTRQYDQSRPILLIDTDHRDLYIFTSNESGGAINYKKSSLDNITFADGYGTPFIQNSIDLQINNATSSKHNVNSRTGIAILASSKDTRYYLHNYLSLGEAKFHEVIFFPMIQQ